LIITVFFIEMKTERIDLLRFLKITGPARNVNGAEDFSEFF